MYDGGSVSDVGEVERVLADSIRRTTDDPIASHILSDFLPNCRWPCCHARKCDAATQKIRNGQVASDDNVSLLCGLEFDRPLRSVVVSQLLGVSSLVSAVCDPSRS